MSTATWSQSVQLLLLWVTDVQQRPSPQTFGVNIQVLLINCLLFLGELKLLETLNVSCNNLSSVGKLR